MTMRITKNMKNGLMRTENYLLKKTLYKNSSERYGERLWMLLCTYCSK